MKPKKLSYTTEVEVRFNETDSMGIVWHGNYLIYFEVGRNIFGKQFGISYLDIYSRGYTTPIVQSICNHKLPLKYGDRVFIETIYIPCESAKMIFRYNLYNQNNQLVCTGETTQVFLDNQNELCLIPPEFYVRWKKENHIVCP